MQISLSSLLSFPLSQQQHLCVYNIQQHTDPPPSVAVLVLLLPHISLSTDQCSPFPRIADFLLARARRESDSSSRGPLLYSALSPSIPGNWSGRGADRDIIFMGNRSAAEEEVRAKPYRASMQNPIPRQRPFPGPFKFPCSLQRHSPSLGRICVCVRVASFCVYCERVYLHTDCREWAKRRSSVCLFGLSLSPSLAYTFYYTLYMGFEREMPNFAWQERAPALCYTHTCARVRTNTQTERRSACLLVQQEVYIEISLESIFQNLSNSLVSKSRMFLV